MESRPALNTRQWRGLRKFQNSVLSESIGLVKRIPRQGERSAERNYMEK